MTDGFNGRCAMGVIMSYYGWNGKDSPDMARALLGTLATLRHANINTELVIAMNEAGATFEEIADYLDRNGK
jgi:hypothetical protein